MKPILRVVCVFTAVAGCWLAVMELILHHTGYPVRFAVDLFLVAQACAIVRFLSWENRGIQAALLLGALAAGAIGLSAIISAAQAPHFEGYAVLIGAALILEALLMLAISARPSAGRALANRIA